MNQMINEHDLTKKMINVLRTKSILTEADEGTDVISPSEESPEFKDEVKKIADTVDQRLQITKFKIYPRDRDVQFEGRLDVGINFYMSTKNNEINVSITDENGKARMIELDAEVMGILQRLLGYYDNWKKEWGAKLNTEYKQK